MPASTSSAGTGEPFAKAASKTRTGGNRSASDFMRGLSRFQVRDLGDSMPHCKGRERASQGMPASARSPQRATNLSWWFQGQESNRRPFDSTPDDETTLI